MLKCKNQGLLKIPFCLQQAQGKSLEDVTNKPLTHPTEAVGGMGLLAGKDNLGGLSTTHFLQQ
jgi:hypothetical protein